MGGDILSETQIQGLLKYKYKGGDTSYLYLYVLSPLAQLGVDYCPVWVAPNTITLTGLCFCISAFILTIIYNPLLSTDAPRWLHLYSGVSLFLYQTLDNMDGKQVLYFIQILLCCNYYIIKFYNFTLLG
jgi:ethanolaminephosphotransferase